MEVVTYKALLECGVTPFMKLTKYTDSENPEISNVKEFEDELLSENYIYEVVLLDDNAHCKYENSNYFETFSYINTNKSKLDFANIKFNVVTLDKVPNLIYANNIQAKRLCYKELEFDTSKFGSCYITINQPEIKYPDHVRKIEAKYYDMVNKKTINIHVYEIIEDPLHYDHVSNGDDLEYLDFKIYSKAEAFGEFCFCNNRKLTEVDLTPLVNLKQVFSCFLYGNAITFVDLTPLIELEFIEENFLAHNNLSEIKLGTLPKVKFISDNFLNSNLLTSIELPKLMFLQEIGNLFLANNQLNSIDLSGLVNVRTIGNIFLGNNNIENIDISCMKNLSSIGSSFCLKNPINRILTGSDKQLKNFLVKNLHLKSITIKN